MYFALSVVRTISGIVTGKLAAGAGRGNGAAAQNLRRETRGGPACRNLPYPSAASFPSLPSVLLSSKLFAGCEEISPACFCVSLCLFVAIQAFTFTCPRNPCPSV